MVRTKADGIKAVGAKAPRKVAVSSPRSGGSAKGKVRHGGGNMCNSQPVPAWQRPVASFFSAAQPRTSGSSAESSSRDAAVEEAGSSSPVVPDTELTTASVCASQNTVADTSSPAGDSGTSSPVGDSGTSNQTVDPAGGDFSSNGIISDDEE